MAEGIIGTQALMHLGGQPRVEAVAQRIITAEGKEVVEVKNQINSSLVMCIEKETGKGSDSFYNVPFDYHGPSASGHVGYYDHCYSLPFRWTDGEITLVKSISSAQEELPDAFVSLGHLQITDLSPMHITISHTSPTVGPGNGDISSEHLSVTKLNGKDPYSQPFMDYLGFLPGETRNIPLGTMLDGRKVRLVIKDLREAHPVRPAIA